MITQEYLKTRFTYNENTGIVKWLSCRNTTLIGSTVGSLSNDGALTININSKTYLLHRLIWVYVYGHFPDGQIDHKNHCKTDNRISNLRDVTHHDNMKNKSLYKNNRTGHVGVRLTNSGKYRAAIGIDGVTKHIGVFDTALEASLAREEYKSKLGYHSNHK